MRVIGVPSKKWGEAVHAFVVVRDGIEVEEDEIMEYCRTQISSFKCPRTMDIQTNPLPKSAAGKIQEFESVSYTHLTLPTNREV